MDAASNVAKRNTLAQHLREVVDVLEQKVSSCDTYERQHILSQTSQGQPNCVFIRSFELQKWQADRRTLWKENTYKNTIM